MRNYPSTDPKNSKAIQRDVDLEILSIDYNKFHHPEGKDIFNRLSGWSDLIDKMKKDRLFLYSRRTLTPPGSECYGMDEFGEIFYGLNFASADYLGLSQHQYSKDAARQAAEEYGVNSCGSPLAFGGHKYYYQLIEEIQEFWGVKHVLLLSAGWMAGFGIPKCLVKANDYIVLDELAHNCLLEGAKAATSNCFKVKHLDNGAMEAKIKEIREKQPDAGIFVITEGLFRQRLSRAQIVFGLIMDADTPNLGELQQICKKYDAFMMIDSAHDFGCMGATGKGCWELFNMKDKSNVVFMAGGSKCLSTNLGWVACDNKHVIEYCKVHMTAFMFTNAVNPIQCATALSQLRILGSHEGTLIRQKVMENYKFIRDLLESKGFRCLGNPCPILIVFIGNEIVCRLVSRLMMDEGVHVNGIEYPVVQIGKARLRLNLMPQHTHLNMIIFVETYERVLKRANDIYEKALEKLQQKFESQDSKL